MDNLRKKGVEIQPIEIAGRTIASSYWGKGWCNHLDSFSDFSNRLPRGRTYVRNGSVCHLDIRKGEVEAIVSGSSLYTINIKITPLTLSNWGTLKQQCTGKIGSLLELLQGRLSDEIMDVVTDKKKGLFPLPGEIEMDCNCPDGARMCKHIAAVVYGIGARLDTRPELLFLLRGVNHEELIDADTAATQITGGKSQRDRRRTIASDALEDVFGVELEDAAETPPAQQPKASKTAKKKAPAKKAAKNAVKKTRPFKPTPRTIAKLRKRLGMTHGQFAKAAGVSVQSIKNWEESTGSLTLRAASIASLTRLHEQ
jgi:uncharacterized Zn finger protein